MKFLYLYTLGFLSLILGGCDSTYQTTSGQSYLRKAENDNAAISSFPPSDVDREVLEIASVEPTLRFPARIGLARIYRGQLTNLPTEEGTAWLEASERLGKEFGDFVTVSPLIAEMVAPQALNANNGRTHDIVRQIRLASARQHLDAVLIYEVYSNTHRESLVTSVAIWSIIGAYIVPSEKSETVGFANALLLDVRNGYPYGTVTATVTKEAVYAMAYAYDKTIALEDRNQIETTKKLIPDVEKLFRVLSMKLRDSDKVETLSGRGGDSAR